MIDAYLDRIGLRRDDVGELDAHAMRRIAAAHAATVPFENTRAHRGEPISVRIDDVLARLVERREGGVCYELNGGLGWLLAELGARVRLVSAQVLAGADEPENAVPGLPMSHMALVVRLPSEGEEMLVDVGFGGELILRPAPVDGERVATDRGTSYLVDTRPRELADFEGVAWWHSTSPASRFMRGIIVSSTRPEGIATLSGRGDGDLAWRFRAEGDSEHRDLGYDQAQRIAAEVFELGTPLPRRILRYGPLAT